MASADTGPAQSVMRPGPPTPVRPSPKRWVSRKNIGGEKSIGEKPKLNGEKSPLAKSITTVDSSSKEFSPTNFRQSKKKEFSPTKKQPLKLVKSKEKAGKRGRPRNPALPPAPGEYFYWTKAGNGLKLEQREPQYAYIGFIMPQEWQSLRGHYDEAYILKIITAAIRVKRARSAQNQRNRRSAAAEP